MSIFTLKQRLLISKPSALRRAMIFLMAIFMGIFYMMGELSRVSADPVTGAKSLVEQSILTSLSPYLTHPDRRDPLERLSVRGGQAEIWRYESFEQGEVEDKLCLATRSLLFGRLPSNEGVKALFRRHNELRDLSLIFYRQKTAVTPQLSGQYLQEQKSLILARFTLLRERVFSLDLKQAEKTLSGVKCVERAKVILNDLWISESILERREALKEASIELNALKASKLKTRDRAVRSP